VRDTANAPIPSVEVIARIRGEDSDDVPRTDSPEVRARAAVDSNGRFALDGLDEREVELWVVDPASGDVVNAARVAGGEARVEILLNRVARVRLVGPDGRPVARSQVRLKPQRPVGRHVDIWAFSDEAGVARFPDLDRRRTYDVTVEVPFDREDLARVDATGWVPREVRVIDVPAGRSIDGRTVDEKGVGKTAWIHHRSPDGRSHTASTTDPEGRFRLRGVAIGPVELAATPFWDDSHRSDVAGGPRWNPFSAEGNRVVVTIQASEPPPPVKRFTVRVVGPDGSVPDRVVVHYDYEGGGHSEESPTGKVTLEEKPAGGVVSARSAQDAKGDLLPWAPAHTEVRAGGGDVELRMGEGLRIEGRVIDEQGRPLAGMTVTALPAGTFFHRAPSTWARSGADGSFRLVGLGPEEVDVTVEETVDTPASAAVQARGGDRGLALTVRRATPSRVWVQDADGRPVRGAQFTVMRYFTMQNHGVAATGVVSTETPADGGVDVPALDPTLHLSLRVEPPKDRDDLSRLDIDPWRPASGDVTVPRGFTAALVVLDTEGRPIRARVTQLLPSGRPGMGGWGESGQAPSADGVIRVRALPLGPTRFTASPLGKVDFFPPASPPVEVDEKHPTAELRVPTKGLPMTVMAPGAEPERHFGFLITEPGAYMASARAFEFTKSGEAVLDRIAPGRFVVVVLRRGDSGNVGRVEVPAFAGEEVRVPMGAVRTIRVRLKVPRGTSEVSATLFAHDHEIAERTADADGNVVFEGVPPGAYVISAFGRDGKQSLRGVAQAEAGSEAEIELTPSDD
jgi:hypothetical protein